MFSGSSSTASKTQSATYFRSATFQKQSVTLPRRLCAEQSATVWAANVLTTGRVAVASEAKNEIQKILTIYESGVRLVTVELQDVTPPDTVKPAFNEVNESRQDKERTINKAQEQANREIPKARGVATQSISEAEGYALERVNRAQGEATRFEAILGQYEQAPQVTRRRLYLEAMTGFLSNMKGLYIVDKDQKAMVPWLPLESSGQPSTQGRKP